MAKKTLVKVAAAIHQKAKVRAAREGRTLESVVDAALSEYLRKPARKPKGGTQDDMTTTEEK